MIAPDETTFAYLKGRPHAPPGADWDAAVEYWQSLRHRRGRDLRHEVVDRRRPTLTPFVTWGTNPGQGAAARRVACPTRPFADPDARAAAERALEYMGLTPGTPLRDDRGRHGLRRLLHQRPDGGPAGRGRVLRGRQVADGVRMLVVPGSMQVRAQAEAGGPGRGLQRRGRRVARGGLLDVPGHEPGHAQPGRAQRLHLQPQLRGPSGQGRPYPPGLARRSPPPPPSPAAWPPPPTCKADLSRSHQPWTNSPPTPAGACRCGAATSTPTRSSRPSSSSGSAAPDSRRACSPPGARTRLRPQPAAYEGASILVAGPDFGTGSSREHAVWALPTTASAP